MFRHILCVITFVFWTSEYKRNDLMMTHKITVTIIIINTASKTWLYVEFDACRLVIYAALRISYLRFHCSPIVSIYTISVLWNSPSDYVSTLKICLLCMLPDKINFFPNYDCFVWHCEEEEEEEESRIFWNSKGMITILWKQAGNYLNFQQVQSSKVFKC